MATANVSMPSAYGLIVNAYHHVNFFHNEMKPSSQIWLLSIEVTDYIAVSDQNINTQ